MPRFTTPIPAGGPKGNIFAVMVAAASMLRELGISSEVIGEFVVEVLNAGSHAEALDVVRQWFAIEGDEK